MSPLNRRYYKKTTMRQKYVEVMFGREKQWANHYYPFAIPAAGIDVMIPTPRTRPSRNNILIPGRIYSGRFANSNVTLARDPGRKTIQSSSPLSPRDVELLVGIPTVLLLTLLK